MKRRMTIIIEKESDGIGYHAFVIGPDDSVYKTAHWQMSRFESWKAGTRLRRMIEEDPERAKLYRVRVNVRSS